MLLLTSFDSSPSGEELKKISDVKYMISELYEALNIQEFHVEKEAQLVKVPLT